MKILEFKKLIREEVRKVLNEATVTTPTTYDFNNPGDEWKTILTKAMEQYNAYPNKSKVKKDTKDLLTIVYKLGAKKTGKSISTAEAQEYVEYLLSGQRSRIMMDSSATVTDLIDYIKNDLDPNGLPNRAAYEVRKQFKKGKLLKITPTTKLKVGDNIVSMSNMTSANIVNVDGDRYSVAFAMDVSNEKPRKTTKKSLQSNWLLVKK